MIQKTPPSRFASLRGSPHALVLLVFSLTLAPHPARAADPLPDPDKILLSVPDAGGLRLVVRSDNTLAIHVAGKDLPPLPGIPFVGFTADTSGYVNGGSATIGSEKRLANLFGTGLELRLLSGSKVTASTTGVTFDGGVRLILPLKGSDNTPLEADIASLTIQRNGTLDIDTTVVPPASKLPLQLPGGFTLAAQRVQVKYHHTPGSDEDDAAISLTNVDISAPLPGILTESPAPLKLHVGTASVNTDGQVSFTGAQAAALTTPGRTQVAGLRPVGLARTAGFPLRIPLMKPADFVIIVNKSDDVTLDMENNVPVGFTLTCDVELPGVFSATPGGATRVKATGVHFDVGAGGFLAHVASLPTSYFKGFGVAVTDATLDLSESASPTGAPGGAPWQGLFLNQAKLVLPHSITFAEGTADAPDLSLHGAWIDNNGFTGEVQVSNGKLSVEDFAVELKKLNVKVQRNSLSACEISGGLKVTALGDAPIEVEAAISDSGLASLQVKTGKLSIKDFNAELELEKGAVQHQPDGKTTLALSGTWRFTSTAPEVVQGLAVQVKDLQVDSTGSLTLESVWIDLPESASLDLDVVSLEARKIGFGGIGPGKRKWVGLTGAVGIAGDLPIQAQADFDGLTIYADGEVALGRIGVDCDVKGIVHVSGYLEQSKGEMTRTIASSAGAIGGKIPLKLADGSPLTVVTGKVALALPILGSDPDSDSGPGGAVEFLVARNCWFVMGSISSNVVLIPLGQTGLGLYGFGGGVGYNVTSELPGATGIPQRNYQVIPDIPAIEGKKASSVLALASVRVGTVATTPTGPPLWGDITLVVQLPELHLTLQGDCYLVDAMPVEVPANPATQNRIISGRLSFDAPTRTFIASVSADLSLPKKEELQNGQDNTLVRLKGQLDFKIGQFNPATDTGFQADNNRVLYAKLGGPITLGPPLTISNPVTLKVRGINPIEGAATLDLNAGKLMAALRFDQDFHADSDGRKSFDVGIGTVYYCYALDAHLNAEGWLQLNFADFNNLNGEGDFHAVADVTGKATGLRYEGWGPDFNLPDLGFCAHLDGDLHGKFSPSELSVSGSVAGKLGFRVKGQNLSFDFAKDIEWKH